MTTRRQFAVATAAAFLRSSSRAAETACSTFPHLLQDGALTFPPLASIKPPFKDLPTPKPFVEPSVVERPLLSSLQAHPDKLAALIKAYKILATLQKDNPGYPVGLANLASMHKYYCGDGAGVHVNWAFLLWHRGFLYFHEQALRKILGDDFRLPVWDWEHSPAVPQPWGQVLVDSAVAEVCSRGPALKTPINSCRLQAWMFSNTAPEFVGTAAIAGYAPAGVHSDVHTQIGGGFAWPDTSASDPLFYAHHANVDRYWWHWHEQFGYSEHPKFWDQWYYFFDGEAQPVVVHGEQLKDMHKLGYKYAQPQVTLKGLVPVSVDDLTSISSLWKLLTVGMTWAKASDRATIEAEIRKGIGNLAVDARRIDR